MNKDNLRPLNLPASVSFNMAPFAEASGVGIQLLHSDDGNDTEERKRKNEDSFYKERMTDPSVNAHLRGRFKIKGLLSPTTSSSPSSSLSRKHTLSRFKLGSDIEFRMEKESRSIHARLEEIAILKAQVEEEKDKRKQQSKLKDERREKEKEEKEGREGNKTEEDELNEEKEKLLMKLKRVKTKAELMQSLKEEQHQIMNASGALELERIRRLLPPPSSTSFQSDSKDLNTGKKKTIYDFYAVKIQSCFRCYSQKKWYATIYSRRETAATILQRYVRGFIIRCDQKMRKLRGLAVVKLQRCFRGSLVRRALKHKQYSTSEDKNAILIQRIWRGFLGKRRGLVIRRQYMLFFLLLSALSPSHTCHICFFFSSLWRYHF